MAIDLGALPPPPDEPDRFPRTEMVQVDRFPWLRHLLSSAHVDRVEFFVGYGGEVICRVGVKGETTALNACDRTPEEAAYRALDFLRSSGFKG